MLSCLLILLHLCDELNDTTSLLDLPLRILAEVTGADDDRDLRDTALAENLGVAEREEVEDRRGVLASLTGEVLLALLSGDEGPELLPISVQNFPFNGNARQSTYLVEVHNGLPELVLKLVEVSHTDLSEVTRVVLVHVGAVVVLTTGETTTTGVLPVLSDTTVTGGDVSAAVELCQYSCTSSEDEWCRCWNKARSRVAMCFRCECAFSMD